MAGLIGAGQGLRNLANQGMAKVASADVQAEILREQEEMANEAGEKQLLGTAGGIGGMIGAPKAIGMAKDVKAAKDTLTAAKKTKDLADVAIGLEGAAGGVSAGTAAGGTVAGEAVAAAQAGVTSTAATSGTLAQLSAVAAPIAIALGVGFLINKLF
jgi:hypothetical protein|tara:strand:- start:176 stop:646 length:471 start_codon:yes stop_codon:yes gene_type:complete